MAAPTLVAQGAIAAVTTGSLTVTLPAHQADDILVVTLAVWEPNAASDMAAPGTTSGWTYRMDNPIIPGSQIDGRLAMFWKRATSGAETNPVFTQPSPGDTGADTAFAGRAYVIRGCITSGDPWDDIVQNATPYTAANGAFPAVTVSGSERLVVQFLVSTDNQAAGAAPSGWTAGTAVTSATGTDSGFQTFRKDNVSTSTAADTSTVAAPAAGAYGFFGVSFKPPASSPQTVTPTALASAGALGTPTIQTAISVAMTALGSASSLGAVTAVPGGVSRTMTGLASASSFGSATALAGGVTVSVTGLGSASSLGVVSTGGSPQSVNMQGLASASAFGSLSALPGAVTRTMSALASASTFGSISYATGPTTRTMSGLVSASALGAPSIASAVNVPVVGLGSAAAFGSIAIATGPTTRTVGGLASASSFGSASADGGTPSTFNPAIHGGNF